MPQNFRLCLASSFPQVLYIQADPKTYGPMGCHGVMTSCSHQLWRQKRDPEKPPPFGVYIFPLEVAIEHGT